MTKNEIAAQQRAQGANQKPVDVTVHRLFTFAPVYAISGLDKQGVNLYEQCGITSDLQAIKFSGPIGHCNDTPIHWLFALPDAPFETLAEEVARFGIVDRKEKTYWRIDRSDIELVGFPLPETPAISNIQLRVFVFTPSNNYFRCVASKGDGAFFTISGPPDDALLKEANAIL